MFDAREEAKALDELEPFTFIGMDGETYEMPPLATLTQGQAIRFQSGDMGVFAEIMSDESYEALLALPVGVGEKLGLAWVAASGEPGKERLPSSRSPATAKRSPRTSRRAA